MSLFLSRPILFLRVLFFCTFWLRASAGGAGKVEQLLGDVLAAERYIKANWGVGVIYPVEWGQSPFTRKAASVLHRFVEGADFDSGWVDITLDKVDDPYTPFPTPPEVLEAAVKELVVHGVLEKVGAEAIWRITAAPDWFPPNLWHSGPL